MSDLASCLLYLICSLLAAGITMYRMRDDDDREMRCLFTVCAFIIGPVCLLYCLVCLIDGLFPQPHEMGGIDRTPTVTPWGTATDLGILSLPAFHGTPSPDRSYLIRIKAGAWMLAYLVTGAGKAAPAKPCWYAVDECGEHSYLYVGDTDISAVYELPKGEGKPAEWKPGAMDPKLMSDMHAVLDKAPACKSYDAAQKCPKCGYAPTTGTGKWQYCPECMAELPGWEGRP